MVISAKVLIPCYGGRFVNDPNSFANNSSVTYILHIGGKKSFVFGVLVAERREFLMYGIRFPKIWAHFYVSVCLAIPPFLTRIHGLWLSAAGQGIRNGREGVVKICDGRGMTTLQSIVNGRYIVAYSHEFHREPWNSVLTSFSSPVNCNIPSDLNYKPYRDMSSVLYFWGWGCRTEKMVFHYGYLVFHSPANWVII